MRKCQNCKRKVQFVIHIIDTGEQDFDPVEKGLFDVGQDWCLACVYREGNHQVYKDEPRHYLSLDSFGAHV